MKESKQKKRIKDQADGQQQAKEQKEQKERKERKEQKEQTGSVYEKHYRIVQDIAYVYRFYREHIPAFLWLCLFEIVLGAAAPYFGIYLPKLAVDMVTRGAGVRQVLLLLGGFGALFFIVYTLKSGCEWGKYFLYNTKRNDLIAILFLKSLRVPYRFVEEGEVKRLYWKAVGTINGGDWSALHKLTYGTIAIVQNSISFFLYSMVLGMLSFWMVAILIALSLIQYAINISKIRYMEKFRDEEAELTKKRTYLLYDAMGNTAAAKDIRIFGMRRWLGKQKEQLFDKTKRLEKRKRDAEQRYWQMGSLLSLGRDIFAYVYLIGQAAAGAIGAGEFVLYFGAITGFSGFVGSIMDSLAELRSGRRDMDFYRSYMELPEEELRAGSRHIAELRRPISVEFRDVSFSYGGDTKEKIFDHLNLTIHAGEKMALVGVNGAGKTTLVKLLCGMYEPDEGSILLNGIDRNEFPKSELYQLFSAVFQQKFLLPVTVGENLALSAEYDSERAERALRDAGLEEIFKEKNVSLHTLFGKDLDEDGLELSGGQEQRFLLARALYKDAPFLVLDEPTAALDPIAESEVYDNYSRFSEGKTALFISHRLASTRFSDRIVLIGDGRIVEEGTHEELMEKGGAYAEMFRVQSSYYAKSQAEKEAFE